MAKILGLAFNGEEMEAMEQVFLAWSVLAGKGAVLIQPLLENHADLAGLAAEHVALTVRVITQCIDGKISLMCASLEVPEDKDSISGSRGYDIYPVELQSGKCLLMPSSTFMDYVAYEEYRKSLLACDKCIVALPFWQELSAHSILAHSKLPKI
jgi:hypothetical protein